MLSAAAAKELGVTSGNEVILQIPKPAAVPHESLLGRTEVENVIAEFKYTVTYVLSENDFGSRFSLTGNPDPPRNVFLPLNDLQAKLGQEKHVNALLVGGAGANLQRRLRSSLTSMTGACS